MAILTVEERDQILDTLNQQQREFLINHVKRGKRTVFSNIIANQKGIVLSDEFSLEEAEKSLQEWELIDVIDSGFVNPETCCECGRPLRYQYIVQHQTTKKVLKFGISHFEEHMGLPANIVKEIRQGFLHIDYELDELLEKIEQGFNNESLLHSWPKDLPIPKDIQEHLDVNVPLLDRQINRLWKLQQDYFLTKQQDIMNRTKKQLTTKTIPDEEFDLFSLDSLEVINEEEVSSIEDIILNEDQFKDIIYQLVMNGISGVNEISSVLIEEFGVDDTSFKTGRPKIIVDIVKVLDQYVADGTLIVTEDSGIHNRFYLPVDKIKSSNKI